MIKQLLACSFMIIPFLLFGTTLQNEYQSATPGMGYDKLIILEKDSVYIGGLSIIDGTVGIKGNGAIIDLSGDSISVRGTAKIEIDACVIKGGGKCLALKSNASCLVTNCTFYNNEYGIFGKYHHGTIELVNTIISESSQYGIAASEEATRKLHYLDMYQNTLGDYAEWCPG